MKLILNCNKTVNFFREKQRLCASRGKCWASEDDICPVYGFCPQPSPYCDKEMKKAIKALQRWSCAHPCETLPIREIFKGFFNGGGRR